MRVSQCCPRRCMRRILTVIFSFALLSLFCEYTIYYIFIMQCSWPVLSTQMSDTEVLRILVLADPHLVGVYKGHYFDRMRRDWQMTRAFAAATFIHTPRVVFILGDLFDEGLWSNDVEFHKQLVRYHRIFAHDRSRIVLKNLVGNHDIGFHYAIHPYLDWRFRKQLTGSENTTAVRLWVHAGIPFVLANSMAFEDDHCHLCMEAQQNVFDIGRHLSCSPKQRLRNATVPCPARLVINENRVPSFLDSNSETQQLNAYTRPILLLHFPLFRKNEFECATDNAWDAMPYKDRKTAYRPKWDCLSESATSELLRKLRPRLVLSGHSHYSCLRNHSIPGESNISVPEYTVASFSWRNLPNPSFLMVSVTKTQHAVHKCYLPQETIIIVVYFLGISAILFGPCLRRFFRHVRCRMGCSSH
ncbi:Metallophosphoesterase 1 [Fasciola hepatica]|uniref:Metallophosphoesterase 1 n=1 Tax=Fasciola hepatica TaxID=6192 RepID=A0A4E0RXV4_FASHE|nr:Metallophosphoesterase 1 [Fasciola hepatica]